MAAWEGFSIRKRKAIPAGIWMKCDGCAKMVIRKDVEQAQWVCPECNYHFRLSSFQRINMLLDDGSFQEMYADLEPADPLNFEFRGGTTYTERYKRDQLATGLKDAARVGVGTLCGDEVAFGVTDSRFLMGSMGSVVGEKLTRIIEYATREKLPLVIVSGSGGGARMHEGVLSLCQMAKTAAALGRYRDAGGFFASVLTNPTMGGVAASFASLGDVVLAEPKALIGFAGPRTIWHTLQVELPEGFQTSEFLVEHGFLDMVVSRKELRDTLSRLVNFCVIRGSRKDKQLREAAARRAEARTQEGAHVGL